MQSQPQESDSAANNVPSTGHGGTMSATQARQAAYQRRANGCAAIFASLTLILLVVINLPYRYEVIRSNWYSELLSTTGAISVETEQAVVRGGWPMRYLVSHHPVDYESLGKRGNRFAREMRETWRCVLASPNSVGEHRILMRHFSMLALVFNGCFIVVMVTAGWMGTRLRFRRLAAAKNRATSRMVWDGLSAAAFLCIPLLLGATWYGAYRDHQRFLRLIGPQTSYMTSVEVPSLVANRVPELFHPLFERLRVVMMRQPPAGLLDTVAEMTSLRALGVRDGLDTWQWTQQLKALPELTTVVLSNCDVPVEAHRNVANCARLRRLGFFGTAMTEESVRCYDDLRHLEMIDLRRTSFALSQLGEPKWRESVEEMHLPRPLTDQDDSLRLHGWTRLKVIYMQDITLGTCKASMHFQLHSLPQLTHLYLDRLQRHSLVASDLPRLEQIRDPIDQTLVEMSPSDEVQGQTWFESLDLQNIGLKTCQFAARDLSHVTLRDLGQLRQLRVGSFVFGRSGRMILEPSDPVVVGQMIQQVARVPSLQELDLSALPLNGVDLTPLSRLTQLRELNLSFTGVELDQLTWLSSLVDLETLVMSDLSVETEQLARWLEELPKLKRLSANLDQVESIHLHDKDDLLSLVSPEFAKLQHVVMRDLRRLCGLLRITGPTESIELVNLPRLEELIVTTPWPKRGHTQGLVGLRRFAAGGPELGDETVSQLLACKKLDELTLGYCSVSRDVLRRLSQRPSLTLLAVAGCGVDDALTESWRGMDRLRTVCFDDSQVGADTFAWLRSIPSLRRLSIARVPLNDKAWEQLAELRQLSNVNLSGDRIDPAGLQRLMSDSTIERLNLSGTRLTPDVVDVLVACQGLKQLILRDCEIDPSWMDRILESHPRLLVDVGDDPADLVTAISPARQASFVRLAEGGGFGFVPVFRQYQSVRSRRESERFAGGMIPARPQSEQTLRMYLQPTNETKDRLH